jgi:hypothetical protein
MRVGIIAEGWGDHAVITNILKGLLDINQTDIKYIRPQDPDEIDETDLSQMQAEEFSNWTIVRQECIDRTKIQDFFDGIENNKFIIIHLDTDTRFEQGYDISEPKKENTPIYFATLRENVKNKIDEWLENQFVENIAYAIAIEETDAWVLTIYTDSEETGIFPNAKERFLKELNKPNVLSKKDKQKIFSKIDDKFAFYKILSDDFRKPKKLAQLTNQNLSLKLFCEDLQRFNAEKSDE